MGFSSFLEEIRDREFQKTNARGCDDLCSAMLIPTINNLFYYLHSFLSSPFMSRLPQKLNDVGDRKGA